MARSGIVVGLEADSREAATIGGTQCYTPHSAQGTASIALVGFAHGRIVENPSFNFDEPVIREEEG